MNGKSHKMVNVDLLNYYIFCSSENWLWMV